MLHFIIKDEPLNSFILNSLQYLCGYFVSYLSPILVFTVFVLPSELDRKTFKESMTQWQR